MTIRIKWKSKEMQLIDAANVLNKNKSCTYINNNYRISSTILLSCLNANSINVFSIITFSDFDVETFQRKSAQNPCRIESLCAIKFFV